MRLNQDCLECIKESQDVFDFLSSAMELVDDHTPEEAYFISHYIMGHKNFGTLTSFVSKLLQTRGKVYSEVKVRIVEKIESLNFDTYAPDDTLVSYAVLFAIMRGIDLSYPNCFSVSKTLGPLDNDGNHRYRVYRRIINSLNSDFVEWLGRERFKGKSIIQSFRNFFFLDTLIWNTKKTNSIPMGVLVETSSIKTRIDLMKKSKKLIVGISPFCNKANFTTPTVEANYKRVLYNSDQTAHCEYAKRILDNASEAKCDILVFPEYSASPEVLKTIQEKLNSLFRTKNHTPFLTFAGSQWTPSDENIQSVFNHTGSLLGKYSKYSNFRSEEDNEYLKKPGANCTFFGIEGIGVFLPSICRDIIDRDYTRDLSGVIFPLMVINSAFSASVNHTTEPCYNIGYELLANSVFCNSCSAIKSEETKYIGHCHIITKEDSIPYPYPGKVMRDSHCERCEHGCLYIAEFFFGKYKKTYESHEADKVVNLSDFEKPTLKVNPFDIESQQSL